MGVAFVVIVIVAPAVVVMAAKSMAGAGLFVCMLDDRGGEGS